ncbi:MAG: hypothetical protein M3N14_02600 [Bacteroidota bacterium]|nr:hypothetical protein [Bacteroidota bacterium]
MIIERDKQDIVIRLNASLVDIEEVQKFADYFRLLESNAQNRGTEEQAAQLARESHKDWMKENAHRFDK